MGNSRKYINRTLHKVMQLNGGSVTGHPRICFGLPHLSRSEGVYLSPEGCNIYLANMARGITVVLLEDVGGQGETPTPIPLWKLEQCAQKVVRVRKFGLGVSRGRLTLCTAER